MYFRRMKNDHSNIMQSKKRVLKTMDCSFGVSARIDESNRFFVEGHSDSFRLSVRRDQFMVPGNQDYEGGIYGSLYKARNSLSNMIN